MYIKQKTQEQLQALLDDTAPATMSQIVARRGYVERKPSDNEFLYDYNEFLDTLNMPSPREFLILKVAELWYKSEFIAFKISKERFDNEQHLRQLLSDEASRDELLILMDRLKGHSSFASYKLGRFINKILT